MQFDSKVPRRHFSIYFSSAQWFPASVKSLLYNPKIPTSKPQKLSKWLCSYKIVYLFWYWISADSHWGGLCAICFQKCSQKSVVYPGVDILCLPFFKTNCLLHQDKLSIILRRVWRSRRRCQDNGLERGLAGNPYHLLPWSSLPHNPLPNSAEKISSS